ncbi:MAG: hypothetical protein IPM24_08730 [Bryobacterales bacterium]|nr:hypothetical protein [Bryobacterales bacterium]
MRFLVLGLVLTVASPGQFHHLATTEHGDDVFFVTPLRQTGTSQASYDKIFVLGQTGPRLLFVPGSQGPPLGPNRPTALMVTGDGTEIAFDLDIPCIGGSSCFLRERSAGYLLSGGGDDPTYTAPYVRMSRNGRFLLTWSSPGIMLRQPAITDRSTGGQTSFGGIAPVDGRIASDGSALFATYQGLIHISPSGVDRLYPAEGITRAALSDSGGVAFYETSGRRLVVLDLVTGTSAPLGPGDRASYGASVSDDGRWVLYVSVIGETPQVFHSRLDGTAWRQLTVSAEGVSEAVLSGDGAVAWVSTLDGRLLQIQTGTGEIAEVLAPPSIGEVGGQVVPGSLLHIEGKRLGGDVHLNGRPAAIYAADATDIFAQVPWDLAEEPGSSVILSVARADSLLEVATPEHSLSYRIFFPTAFLPPVHEDWSGFVTPESPAAPGEVIHIYAVGLGPVDCPVRTGEPAALDRLCGPVTPIQWDYWWTSTDSLPAEVTFAGLAPGMVGLYQVEARVPLDPPADRLKLIANRFGLFVVADFMVHLRARP